MEWDIEGEYAEKALELGEEIHDLPTLTIQTEGKKDAKIYRVLRASYWKLPEEIRYRRFPDSGASPIEFGPHGPGWDGKYMFHYTYSWDSDDTVTLPDETRQYVVGAGADVAYSEPGAFMLPDVTVAFFNHDSMRLIIAHMHISAEEAPNSLTFRVLSVFVAELE